MTHKHSWLLLVLALALTPGQEAIAEPQDRDHTHTLEHDGLTRHFRVHLPPGFASAGARTPSERSREKLPMVLVFHGGGGNIDGMVRTSGMDEAADEHGFIAVYPAGTGRWQDKLLTWNAGRCCGSAMDNDVDDVGFVAELIDFMVDRYAVDRRRVYATGHSNGAQMSYRLACELADRIAAIAPNASQGVPEECRPSRAVPVLHLHGTEDRCALYHGGECGGCFADFFRDLGVPVPRKTWSCPTVSEAVAAWADRNGCEPETAVMLEKGDVRCKTWQGCADGADVTLCTVDGGGHTWPGGTYAPEICRTRPDGALCRRWKQGVGEINRDVDANEVMWEFFRRHRLEVRVSSKAGSAE